MMSKLHEGPLEGIEDLKLTKLYLQRTRVDDMSLSSLKGMKTLEHLDLTRTKVTDEGLKHLESLPNLSSLVIRRTLITPDGVAAFKSRFPNIKVAWEPMK